MQAGWWFLNSPLQRIILALACSKDNRTGRYFFHKRILIKIRHMYSTAQYNAHFHPEPKFLNLLKSPEIDSQPGGPVRHPYLTYRTARLHRLAESIPWNRYLGSFNYSKFRLWTLQHLCTVSSHSHVLYKNTSTVQCQYTVHVLRYKWTELRRKMLLCKKAEYSTLQKAQWSIVV